VRPGRCWTVGSVLAMAVLMLATLIVLCGCGSSAARQRTTPTALPTLGQSVGQLDRLVVSRTDAFPQNHLRFAFPGTVTVTDPTAVQSVARALCALPKMPSGTFHCPADFGITYHLAFSAGERQFPAVSIDATGCETVRGLGTTRWVTTSPGFWHTLGMAIGLAKPDYATFMGSWPTN
jgi:hypothetical protein